MTTGSSLFSKITGGKKFDGLAIKRVYFGNWLRDYSQAIDIGTLSRGISPEIIRIVLWIMAFTEFGYGTKEFEVTMDRLGVYRAEEHIDNPKGYGEGIDARMYDKRLRGPVDPRELDIDSRTGLKNYICNEEGNWPTSSEYVRTSLHKAIARGRKARTSQCSDEDQYEAMRLLGQALHTLEDYSAHSNYCELVLRELGHTDVFPYVGSKCLIELGGRSVYPIVTGSFGGLDFVHSLMGGAQDSLSQIEIGQVQSSLENGANNSDAGENLKLLLDKLPFDLGSTNSDGSSTSASQQIDDLKYSANQPTKEPTEIIAKIYPFLEFRDRIMKNIESFMEKMPFISEIKESISDTITIFIMGAIQPLITPIITDIISVLGTGTEMVVNDEEQFRVWEDPTYDNPTHSQICKDHFSSHLNEPAGKVAVEVLLYAVPLVVEAWEDDSINPNTVTNSILEVFHHPALARTEIQMKMRNVVKDWVEGLEDPTTVLEELTTESTRHTAEVAVNNAKNSANNAGTKNATDGNGHTHFNGGGCCSAPSFNIPQMPTSGSVQSQSQFGGYLPPQLQHFQQYVPQQYQQFIQQSGTPSQSGTGSSDLLGGIAGMSLGGVASNYLGGNDGANNTNYNANNGNVESHNDYPLVDYTSNPEERSYPGAPVDSEGSKGKNYSYYHTDEDFVTPFSQAAAAKAAADAQQAAAGAGSRSIGGSGGSAAGAGYGALMGLAANSMSDFGSTSTANTVPVTDPSVNNAANYDPEMDSGSIGDRKFDSMDVGSDIGEENSWRAMESQQKLQVDDNEEINEPEEESGKSEKSSDDEFNKSSDEESNKSSDEESKKSSDDESEKSSDEEEPQEEYSSDRGFQSEEQEQEPEEEFEEEVEERESEEEPEEEPEKEYEPEEEEVEERPSRFRRFFRFVKENMSDD